MKGRYLIKFYSNLRSYSIYETELLNYLIKNSYIFIAY